MAKYTLGLVGESNVNRPNPETAFAKIQNLLDRADFVFGHMEMSLSDNVQVNERTDDLLPDLMFKVGWKHSLPENMNAWKAAGFDAVSCASNTSGDPNATLYLIKVLDELGIPHAGIGANLDDAHKPAIAEKDGVKFGLLSYTSVFWPQFVQAHAFRPGAATAKAHTALIPSPRLLEMPGSPPTVKTWMDPEALARILDDIAKLRSKVDHVVLSVHWGCSGSEDIQDYRKELAHAAIEAGVDVVIGHHPHRPNGVEIYKGKPVFYSCGNIAFDWWFCNGVLLDGFIPFITFENGEITRISFSPVRRNEEKLPGDIEYLAPDTDAFTEITNTVRRLSEKPFKLSFAVDGDEVVITA